MKDTALVVGASPEEIAKVDRILPNWELASLPVADGELAASNVPAAAKVIVAFAQQKEEDTMSVCEDLRSLPETSDIPILLVINRYQISWHHGVTEGCDCQSRCCRGISVQTSASKTV